MRSVEAEGVGRTGPRARYYGSEPSGRPSAGLAALEATTRVSVRAFLSSSSKGPWLPFKGTAAFSIVSIGAGETDGSGRGGPDRP